MMRWVLLGAVLAVVLVVLDRLLLAMEWKGWINYRRRGLSRPGAAYHGLILESIFNPGAENIHEVKYGEEKEQDESGDPHEPRRVELPLEAHGAETGQVQTKSPTNGDGGNGADLPKR